MSETRNAICSPPTFVPASRRLPRFAAVAAMVLVAVGGLKADSFNTDSYNFPLDGGGGGVSATINGAPGFETFCVDFNNEIYVPHAGYNAYLTPVTSTGFNPDVTRFGRVTIWATISGTTADGFINGDTSALDRYQMAGYLVSLYDLPAGNNTWNNEVQGAIWTLLDPNIPSYTSNLPAYVNATPALDQALQWFQDTSSSGRDSYLANFLLVSDMSMGRGAPMTGGFQEQMTYLPEPGLFGMLALVLVGVLGYIWRNPRVRNSA